MAKPTAATWPYTSWPERGIKAFAPAGHTARRYGYKWTARLFCGHTVHRLRKPRVGSIVICKECAAKAGRKG